MDRRAFELKESAKDGFVDAAVAVPPEGETLRVGELLRKGKGKIVVSDPNEADALATCEALKETSVKGGGRS